MILERFWLMVYVISHVKQILRELRVVLFANVFLDMKELMIKLIRNKTVLNSVKYTKKETLMEIVSVKIIWYPKAIVVNAKKKIIFFKEINAF